jgi:ribosomal-protein-alanine N-acetyltransferase
MVASASSVHAPLPPSSRQASGDDSENNGAAMTIRPIRDSDVAACAALMRRIPLWAQYGVTADEAHAVFRGALAGGTHVRVAEQDGRVIGFIEYVLRGTFGHSGYVRALGVAPEAQGRGVGGSLMDTAEGEIFCHGPNVFLLVSAGNAGAQRFYERRGYRRIGEIPDYLRAGLTEFIYRKTLGPIRPGHPGAE